jgi:hypothetical protein
MMDLWKIKDMIKSGQIRCIKGNKVVIFRRKKSGYPRAILDGVEYIVRSTDNDSLYVAVNSEDGAGGMPPIKVHRSYMVPKSIWRDWRLTLILED